MITTQFNLKTCHLFTVDKINDLSWESQDYIDETIDALATVARNHRNPPLIVTAARWKYVEFAKRRNGEVRREYWPLGI